jgi:hypothetical protein
VTHRAIPLLLTVSLFLLKSPTIFMALSQTDGSHLVLIYESSLHVLLVAFHSQFYKLVEDGNEERR